jgi:signal transduction histidine kinase
MQKKLVFLLYLFFLGSDVHSEPLKPYTYNGTYEHLSVYYQYLEDCEDYTKEEVLDKFRKGDFKYYKKNRTFNKGITSCSYWMAVEVLNASPKQQKFLWSFYNNGLSFSFYELKAGKLVFLKKSSMHQSIEQRPYPVRSISYPFYLMTTENKILFVKVSPTINGNVYFPTDITDIEDYLWYEIDFSYLLGKYFGVLLFTLFTNLCLFFILRKRIYICSTLYIAFVLLFELSDFHFDSLQIHSSIFPFWSYINKGFLITMALFFFTKVFQLFTDMKLHFPRISTLLSKFNDVLLSSAFLSLVLSFVMANDKSILHGTAIFLNSMNYFGFLLVFIIMLIGIIKRHYYFYLFGFSSIFLFYGFISYLLNTLNIMYLPILKPGNILNGLVFEISLQTIFFVHKFKIEMKSYSQKIIKQVKRNQKLSKKMLDIQEVERERIAKNLHDDIGSDITGLRLVMQNNFISSSIPEREQKAMLDSIKEVYAKVRTISHYLKPIEFEGNFIEVLDDQINFYKKNIPSIKFEFLSNVKTTDYIKPEIQIQLIRIIKELYSNAIKHAFSTNITMQLMNDKKTLILFIEDNGIGFNTKDHHKGIGLKNISARVKYLKGDITLDSNKNGTSFIIEIPV